MGIVTNENASVNPQSTTSSVSEIIKDTIDNRTIGLNKELKPIDNRISPSIVDRLLQDYQELIDPAYIPWFAKRFYPLGMDHIHQCASQARQDAKDPKRLFAYLIKKAGATKLG